MPATFVITQGEHVATDNQAATISTLLGSCVACCLWDPVTRVGGMNHILLARASSGSSLEYNLSAMSAMEVLINDILKLGGVRGRLRAKAFGGARMIDGLSDIGADNCAFLISYLEREGIDCVSQSLGGAQARHVIFTPSSGAARMKAHRRLEEAPVPQPARAAGNGLELF